MSYAARDYYKPRYVREQASSAPQVIQAAGSITLPAIVVRGVAGTSGQAAGGISLGAVQVTGAAIWDSNTSRPTVASAGAAWQTAQRAHVAERGNAAQSAQQTVQTATAWAHAVQVPHAAVAPFKALLPQHDRQSTTYEPGVPLRSGIAARHSVGVPHKSKVASAQQDGTPASAAWQTSYQERLRHARPRVRGAYQDAVRAGVAASEHASVAAPLLLTRAARHQDAQHPAPGKHVFVVVPAHVCYTPGGDLVFTALAPASLDLVFSCADEPTAPPQPPVALITIPARRRYFVQNNITLTRVDTGAEIPVQTASVSEDWSGWGYQVSVSVSAKHEAALAPASAGGPVELELVFNGTAIRWLLETEQRERDFPRTTLALSGACSAALLDAPWSAAAVLGTTQAQTLQQIAAAALTQNGVSVGWALDWQAADWLVPAGLWTTRATPIAALDAIAKAAGAFVQPGFSAQTLHVIKKYKAAPWNWASVTPDYELPAAVVRRESIQRITAAGYNRVIVVGETGGGLFDVRRTGSAADVEAEQITETLVCTAAAAAARALPVLADVGRIERQTLKVPVLASLGLIRPGRIIRYVDGGVTKIGVTTSLTAATESGVAAYQTLGVTAYV